MWSLTSKFVARARPKICGEAKRIIKLVKDLSRPVRVAGHAIADLRKTKVELIAENALLRHQLIAGKRHLARPQISKPEKMAIAL